ncbi:MAG: NAD(P)H-binding protein [Chloroflexi bacterium]|nr:NAD(P)H-binding protein [Chloroflexota bacterium]
MSTVLVTGASGFVGSHVLPVLLEAGHTVRGLVTDERAEADVRRRLPPRHRAALEFARGDVTERASLMGPLAGIDAVVHLVAIPRDFSGGRDMARVNTQGTVNVIEAMKAAGVRRLIHLGGMGHREDPKLQFSSSKVRAIQAVEGSGLDWTILDPSIMWGDRDGFFNILAELARRLPLLRFNPGIMPVPGLGRARFQPISVDDVARVVGLCLADTSTIGRRFELGGPRYWTYREITAEVSRAMGVRRLIMPVPIPVIALVAAIYERLRVTFPTASDQLRQLAVDNKGSLTAVKDAFGFEPQPMEGRLGYLRQRPEQQEPPIDG